eukprot:scaffold11700_cov124-Isochrysis_galbana.AAC.1
MPSASSSGAPGRLARSQRSSALAASSSFQAAWSRSANGTPRKRIDDGGPFPNIGGSAVGKAPEGGEAPTVTNPRMQSTRMRLSREKAEAMQASQAACSRGRPGEPSWICVNEALRARSRAIRSARLDGVASRHRSILAMASHSDAGASVAPAPSFLGWRAPAD